MSHVFILTATNHRVPRWSAGVAVHGEAASPLGLIDVLDPPRQTGRSQNWIGKRAARRICDYIAAWGDDKLLVPHSSLRQHPAAIQVDAGVAPEQFDREV